eukprot:gnl/Trimastix_PCT/926.p2 GENE.gnl/Trimastix_PCT/926~~gnl/Trimastix_PCT/926.p2  ORF type:complete len:169 (+),score=28.90 gnl/Trimastix_PCT/926:38-544(+)
MLHSNLARANTVFTFFTTCLSITVCLIAATSFLYHEHPIPATLTTSEVVIRKTHFGEIPDFSINVEADFSKVFHWNVKQVFVYVTAEYQTGAHPTNQVVIWDRIVRESDPRVLRVEGMGLKYPLIEPFAPIIGPVTLRLSYCLCPHSGVHYNRHMDAATTTLAMPQGE